jgi:cyclopropane-fatty-acyl-phospholipid synthase
MTQARSRYQAYAGSVAGFRGTADGDSAGDDRDTEAAGRAAVSGQQARRGGSAMVIARALESSEGTSADAELGTEGSPGTGTAGVTAGVAPAVEGTRAILSELFGPPGRRPFAVRLWDGSVEGPTGRSASRFTLILRRPGALRRMFLPPSELALGEAYLRGDFGVEGDPEEAVGLADVTAARLRSPGTLARLLPRPLAQPADGLPTRRDGGRPGVDLAGRLHSPRRDAAAVRFHYDVGNDFYALWLDRRMVYSCAYFQTGDESLDAAQEEKLEYLCRKLRLEPGERLLDIGCGWGGLVMYAAERYGVLATGITLSQAQADLAREQIRAAGLSDRCRIEVRDYRALPPATTFDKVVSVGMVEHVGRAKLPTYFAEAYRLTRPGGLFLNHGIVLPRPLRFPMLAIRAERLRRGWDAFIQRYVFPDGELLAPGETIDRAERAGWETRDVESLREHYALTLRRWVQRLEARHDQAVRLVGEPTYRAWRLYMAVAAHGFASGQIGIVQTLLSKPDGGSARLPLTRADLYRSAADGRATGGATASRDG